MAVGLDKLAFLLPVAEVEISRHFPAELHDAVNAATGETRSPKQPLYVAGDVPRFGTKASFNTPNYQLSLSHDRASANALCSLQFSAGAFSRNNLEPLDRDRCQDVARAVQADLAEQGLRFDLGRAKLVRVDVAKNTALTHPVACYAPALTALEAKKRVRKMDFGGTGFILGNKTWEVAFYDKGQEMHEKGHGAAMCPPNTLRPEWRLMKCREIKNRLDCDSLEGLRDAWPKLQPAYDELMKRQVFRPKQEKRAGASIQWDALARHVLDKNPRFRWQTFKSEALLLLMVQDLGLGAAKHFVATALGYNRKEEAGKRQLDRINVELEQAAFALTMEGTTSSGHKILELYEELRDRVLSG